MSDYPLPRLRPESAAEVLGGLEAMLRAEALLDGQAAEPPRLVAVIEPAPRPVYDDDDETDWDDAGCTCFKSAPCWWCMNHCWDCRARLEDVEDYDSHRCERAS